MEEDSVSNLTNLNLVLFIHYLIKSNIIGIIIAASISNKVVKLFDSLITDIIQPVISSNQPDSEKIEDKVIKYYNSNIKIGNFIINLFTLLLMITIFYVIYFIVKITNLKF